MNHFLIADDLKNVRIGFRELLESQGNTCEEASNVDEILRLVRRNQSSEDERFDLILLDFDFGDGTTGFTAIAELKEEFGQDYCDHKIVVITAVVERRLAHDFARLGAIGHLLKPVNSAQFWVTIDSALARRELYVEKKEDWESACKLLVDLGVLEGIEDLKICAQEYEVLKATHAKLLLDLQQAGGHEYQIAGAYQQATEYLNASPGNFQNIYSFLRSFGFTEKFVSDVEYIFHSDRLQFLLLQAYLGRVAVSPQSYRVKHLAPGAPNHYEYRVGRNFRLYFRKAVGEQIVLERFGHKNIQPEIISYLNHSANEDIAEM